jgi:hypothetical protein
MYAFLPNTDCVPVFQSAGNLVLIGIPAESGWNVPPSIRYNRLNTNTIWQCYDCDGNIRSERGMCLICDNGYLLCPISICPYSKANNATLEGFFLTYLESVQKDVECTFGILKKWWKMLNHGFKHSDIVKCQHIFITCCVLLNFLFDLMVRNHVRAGRGYLINNDGLWLDGHTDRVDNHATDRILSIQFEMRRKLLANHLCEFQKKSPIL